MKRTPLARTAPMRRSTAPKRCKHCRESFQPERAGQKCHTHCEPAYALAFIEKKRAKEALAKAKTEKAHDKVRAEKLKTIGQIEEECRQIVQKMARLRDRNRGCISCDKPPGWVGQWHGSHYRAHGGCSSIQFHLWNINKACWICNHLHSGRVDQQKVGIVARYGPERLEWLDAQPKSRKYTREYLARFKKVMGKRLRRMEKRIK